jgi:endoglucanase
MPVAPRRRSYTPAIAGGAALLLAIAANAADAPRPVALAHLTRGVNISGWLQHGPAQDAFAPDAGDWKGIRALGLDHVRIPVDPAALVDARGLPRAPALAALRGAIVEAQRADLLVVLALQLPPAPKAGVVEREADRVALGGLWRWLAGALRDLPARQLAFEPLNEPETADARASRALLAYLAAEVRKAAPKHTLVVSGHRYAGVAELEALKALADPNVIYSFHFYEPHNFTHQGADWGDSAWKALRNFPYPSSPESVAGMLASAPAAARDLLRWHGEERWNAARIGALIERAAKWGRQHKVPVWCSEFGVLEEYAPAADRAAWLADVRAALEQRRIPWTHWDYEGAFGIDEKAIEALGLKQ